MNKELPKIGSLAWRKAVMQALQNPNFKLGKPTTRPEYDPKTMTRKNYEDLISAHNFIMAQFD